MDKIDRYILRQFVMTFVFGLLAFIVIYIAVDLMENLDDFLDRNVEAPIILEYYIYMVPDIAHLIVPIGMLLASLFTVGRLDQTNELTAIRASGRSMRRLATPLLIFGLCVSGFMIYFDGWVVPQTNKLHYAIKRQYLGKDLIGGQRNVFLRISPTVNLLMNFFDPTKGEASQVSIERFDTSAAVAITTIARREGAAPVNLTDSANTITITERIDAAIMRYDSTKKVWVLVNGVARNFSDPTRVASTQFESREIPFLPITPHELNLSQQNIQELTLEEFRERIDQEQLSGRDVGRLLVDYYAKFSFPFAAMIVIFFGIPFSSGQRKGGAAVQIAITALVSAIYLILTEISKTFSYAETVPPVLTAWMVNILFVSIGIFNLFRIERG